MKKISVIVPIYNGEVYIKQTIDKILSSTYNNIELILVNDGSTDNSLSICEELRENDSRIFIYSKDNEGVASARNFGVTKATGTYICFMDQDDIVDSRMYEKMISRLEKDQSDMAMCSSGRSIDGKISKLDLQKDGIYQNDEIRNALLLPILFNGYAIPTITDIGNHYSHIWTCIFRRSFWIENCIKFRTYVNFEDDLLVKVEALAKAKCVSTTSYIGYFWRINLNSETYAHHFVRDIGQKQDLCFKDIEKNLMNSEVEPQKILYVKQVLYCKQYLDAVHNLSSPEVKKNIKFIKTYYGQNIYTRDFENVINGRKYLKRGWVKPRIILPLLASKHTYLSFWAELLLDKILIFSLHSQLLTKLERKIKSK